MLINHLKTFQKIKKREVNLILVRMIPIVHQIIIPQVTRINKIKMIKVKMKMMMTILEGMMINLKRMTRIYQILH